MQQQQQQPEQLETKEQESKTDPQIAAVVCPVCLRSNKINISTRVKSVPCQFCFTAIPVSQRRQRNLLFGSRSGCTRGEKEY